jgi:hypothetical protein
MDEEITFETPEEVAAEETPAEAEPVAEVEETPPETPAEEFDEIVYNGEPTKIPVTERKTYLQKGYNYDKVTEKLKAREAELAEYQRREAELAALYGTDTKDLRRQLIATRAEEQGITPEALEKQLALQQEVENLRRVTREAQLTTEKAKLRDKPFFAELEAEIDALLPTSEHWTVQNAYEYLRGKNFEKLTAQAKTSTQKSTIADIQDQARRGITQPGAKAPAGKPLSPEVRKIAQAMGVKI